MSKKRVKYSDTFKAEAIAKIKENNGNIRLTAKELAISISMNTLANWHRKAENGVLAGTRNYNPELIAALDEIKVTGVANTVAISIAKSLITMALLAL